MRYKVVTGIFEAFEGAYFYKLRKLISIFHLYFKNCLIFSIYIYILILKSFRSDFANGLSATLWATLSKYARVFYVKLYSKLQENYITKNVYDLKVKLVKMTIVDNLFFASLSSLF